MMEYFIAVVGKKLVGLLQVCHFHPSLSLSYEVDLLKPQLGRWGLFYMLLLLNHLL